MSRIFVCSALTADQHYTTWSKAPVGGIPVAEKQILIKGGSNVANKFFITPRGVITEITEEEYEHLNNNETFKTHKQNGYITIRNEKVDPEVAVAAGMKQKDESAPVTPNDFPDGEGRVKPAEAS